MAKLENEYEDNLDDECEDIWDEEGNKLPRRCEDKYKEIEDLELYEFTHCIAYEMGIRNVAVKDLLDELNYFLERKSYLISGNQTISHTAPEKYEKYSKLGILHLNELIEAHEKRLIDEYLLYPHERHNESKEINNYLAIRKALSNTSAKPDDKYKWNYVDNKSFDIYQGIFANSTTFDISHIFTSFKRQVKSVNKAEITLNMSLPKKEIIAFVEKIKDEYVSNPLIKNPYELLGFECEDAKEIEAMSQIEWADCFFIYDFFNASSDKNISTKEQKLQEMLTERHGVKVLKRGRKKNKYETVSYQTYKDMIGMSDDKDEFQIYRPANKDDRDAKKKDQYVKKEYQPYWSTKTIGKRLKLMKMLIDNLQYKTLLVN